MVVFVLFSFLFVILLWVFFVFVFFLYFWNFLEIVRLIFKTQQSMYGN